MIAIEPDTATVGFEQQYLALRQKEKRIYPDEEVLHLPDLPVYHPHYAEWQVRKESCNRLKNYFEKRFSSLHILEVGCGNGWLAHRLASLHGCEITATDINLAELQQAKRVFSHISHLQFIPGGINADAIENKQYDFIVFAACIQYFPSLNNIIRQSLDKLEENGELHILDSPFYLPGEITAAQKRTSDYYENLGFPEMIEHYFHHSTGDLNSFNHKILYKPSFLNHHFLNKKNPFPWICIKK